MIIIQEAFSIATIYQVLYQVLNTEISNIASTTLRDYRLTSEKNTILNVIRTWEQYRVPWKLVRGYPTVAKTNKIVKRSRKLVFKNHH